MEPVSIDKLARDGAGTSTQDIVEPTEPVARLPDATPEALGVEPLEERALLSADAASQVPAPAAPAPAEPPALFGSPVAGAKGGASGSERGPIVADGQSGARAAEAVEVVAELAKKSGSVVNATTGDQKPSHSTESGEIAELKIDVSNEPGSEMNADEKLEHGAEPENELSDARGDDSERPASLHRRVVGELLDKEPLGQAGAQTGAMGADAPWSAPGVQTSAGDVAAVRGESPTAPSPVTALEIQSDLRRSGLELSGIIDELGRQHAEQIVQADQFQPGAAAPGGQAVSPTSSEQVTPEAHDAYFAHAPDLAAESSVESAAARPVLNEPA